RGVLHHLGGVRVAVHGGLVHGGGGDVFQLAAHHVDQHRRGAGVQALHGPPGDGRAAGVLLQAPVVAALAAPSVAIDGHVSDLPGHVAAAVVDLAVQHD